MKRKVLSVLLCAAMTLGVVAGCGSSSDTGSTDSASKTETKGENRLFFGQSDNPYVLLE